MLKYCPICRELLSINVLCCVALKNSRTNNTGWEDSRYIALLNRSTNESNPEKRKAILREAERLLINEMPIAPLFYSTFNYVKKRQVSGVSVSELGYINFLTPDHYRY